MAIQTEENYKPSDLNKLNKDLKDLSAEENKVNEEPEEEVIEEDTSNTSSGSGTSGKKNEEGEAQSTSGDDEENERDSAKIESDLYKLEKEIEALAKQEEDAKKRKENQQNQGKIVSSGEASPSNNNQHERNDHRREKTLEEEKALNILYQILALARAIEYSTNPEEVADMLSKILFLQMSLPKNIKFNYPTVLVDSIVSRASTKVIELKEVQKPLSNEAKNNQSKQESEINLPAVLMFVASLSTRLPLSQQNMLHHFGKSVIVVNNFMGAMQNNQVTASTIKEMNNNLRNVLPMFKAGYELDIKKEIKREIQKTRDESKKKHLENTYQTCEIVEALSRKMIVVEEIKTHSNAREQNERKKEMGDEEIFIILDKKKKLEMLEEIRDIRAKATIFKSFEQALEIDNPEKTRENNNKFTSKIENSRSHNV